MAATKKAPASPTPGEDRHISYAIRDAMIALAAKRETTELSTRQLGFLFLLFAENGPITVRGISAHIGMSKPAVSRATKSLETLGWVERATDTGDRRSVLVSLTGLGRKEMAKLCILANKAGPVPHEPAERCA